MFLLLDRTKTHSYTYVEKSVASPPILVLFKYIILPTQQVGNIIYSYRIYLTRFQPKAQFMCNSDHVSNRVLLLDDDFFKVGNFYILPRAFLDIVYYFFLPLSPIVRLFLYKLNPSIVHIREEFCTFHLLVSICIIIKNLYTYVHSSKSR